MSGEIGDVAPSLMRASLVRSGKWAGGVGAIGGFVADILQPLAPFAAYIALIASVAAFVIAIAIVFRLVLAVRAMPALVFATTTAAIAGQLAGAQYGHNAIPRPWLGKLHAQGMIFGMARQLIDATSAKKEQPPWPE